MIARGLLLAYLATIAATGADYKLTQQSDYTNWRLLFDFSVVSFVLVFMYHVITFVSPVVHPLSAPTDDV